MNLHFIETQIAEIWQFISNQELYKKETLTLDQAAKYMDISKSFLYKLTMRRVIPFSKPGAKMIFFKKSDLDDWMLGRRFPTVRELSIIPNQKQKGGVTI